MEPVASVIHRTLKQWDRATHYGYVPYLNRTERALYNAR